MDNSGYFKPKVRTSGGNTAAVTDDWERPVTRQSLVVSNSQIASPSAPTSSSKIIDLARPGFQLPKELYQHPDFQDSVDASAPNGLFAGYPIVGGHSGVNQGVYLANDLSEAILIEDHNDVFERLYNELTLRLAIAKQEGEDIEDAALSAAQEITLQSMRYTPNSLYKAAMLDDINGVPLVSFNFYLQVRSGCARHLVLLAAYLMERLILRSVVGGSMYIDNALSYSSAEQENLTYRTILGGNKRFSAAQEGLKPRLPNFNPFND